MRRTRTFGIGLTALAVLGYAIGVAAPYPGRSSTIVGVMVGVTLLSIGGGEREWQGEPERRGCPAERRDENEKTERFDRRTAEPH